MSPSITTIRRDFCEGNLSIAKWLDEPVYKSWQRCAANKMTMSGSVDYRFLQNHQLDEALSAQRRMLDAAEFHLHNLYRTISGAGWSVLLTDTNCVVLKTYKSNSLTEKKISLAFKEGIVLTEDIIGTSAMSCAISENRPVTVFGHEHYKDHYGNFNCTAVPIYDQYGAICSVVDITNEKPYRDPATLYLLNQCAQNIQTDIIKSLPNSICIELSSEVNPFGETSHIVLAFSYDQQLIGLNMAGSRFLNIDLQRDSRAFSDLFEEDFLVLLDNNSSNSDAFKLTLNNGVSLMSRTLRQPEGKILFPSRLEHSSTAGSREEHTSHKQALPYFGDKRINEELENCIKGVSRLPVLLLGESGVGKEVAAKAIHENSQHKNGEFVAVNCASIPETLIESELFGYERGAFTGADRNGQIGKIGEADGGTLFLDEIGDMPLILQTRLLRVLETKEVLRVGATKAKTVNFQVICATHCDLQKAVREGSFRQDLFYRLNGISMTLPPLRDRNDISGLAINMLESISSGKRIFDESALNFIEQYDWPGNVRELKHSLIYADTLAHESWLIKLDDFPKDLLSGRDKPSVAVSNIELEGSSLEETCNQAVLSALKKFNGNKSQAAQYLGISRATLYRKLAQASA